MKLFFKLLTILLVLQINVFAAVEIDYPNPDMGIFGDWEDKDMPGIPSTNIDEYKLELKEWAKQANIELDDSSINNYIQKSLDCCGWVSWW